MICFFTPRFYHGGRRRLISRRTGSAGILAGVFSIRYRTPSKEFQNHLAYVFYFGHRQPRTEGNDAGWKPALPGQIVASL
jgi:hypothetical protein